MALDSSSSPLWPYNANDCNANYLPIFSTASPFPYSLFTDIEQHSRLRAFKLLSYTITFYSTQLSVTMAITTPHPPLPCCRDWRLFCWYSIGCKVFFFYSCTLVLVSISLHHLVLWHDIIGFFLFSLFVPGDVYPKSTYHVCARQASGMCRKSVTLLIWPVSRSEYLDSEHLWCRKVCQLSATAPPCGLRILRFVFWGGFETQS